MFLTSFELGGGVFFLPHIVPMSGPLVPAPDIFVQRLLSIRCRKLFLKSKMDCNVDVARTGFKHVEVQVSGSLLGGTLGMATASSSFLIPG